MTRKTASPRRPSTGCTCLRLRKAARGVSTIFDQYLQRAGLTVTQYGLLGHLKSFDGIGIGELADKLIMDPTTLTRNLRPLQRQGLVVLAPDPRDRRSRCLHLTARGRAAFDRAVPEWMRAQRHIEKTLGVPNAAALNAALDRMLDLLVKPGG